MSNLIPPSMVSADLISHNLGYPRIGIYRELKKATEAFWKKQLSLESLQEVGREIRKTHWLAQKAAGMDLIPSNDFSFYDQVLDMSCLLGNVPVRFAHWIACAQEQSMQQGLEPAQEQLLKDPVDRMPRDLLEVQFQIARGQVNPVAPVSQAPQEGVACCEQQAVHASEMTKWFDTNYHYIVPEFSEETQFSLMGTKVFDEFKEALGLGIRTKPVLIGPLTYLALGKDPQDPNFDPLTLLPRLLPVYVEILQKLAALGCEWVQLDEPILVLDLNPGYREAFQSVYQQLRDSVPQLRFLLATYFGELRENLQAVCELPVDALHVDATRMQGEVELIAQRWPQDRILSVGIVDGRNIWKNDFEASLKILKQLQAIRGTGVLWVAPSCSLMHVPETLQTEAHLDPELLSWMAFAREKLDEVVMLTHLLSGEAHPGVMHENQEVIASRLKSDRIHNAGVKKRAQSVSAKDLERHAPFLERRAKQMHRLGLPLFPTTTIGSFPQTPEVRNARARWKSGKLNDADYQVFLKEEIAKAVQFQEEAGLDVLVHGEFERNDMVEYFGEQLQGFAFTQNGWVQSYGSRYVKPPIIFGDVARPHPMTVNWSIYAQSLTSRPMKGMLTGPVTILQWSFVRDDQPRSETARQIALALRDEVLDLERAGIGVIQVDEPALREGLPLRQADWKAYLQWAVSAFRLSVSGVGDETQIHTHMCYSEFNDIIEFIADLDADVISIETARSNRELLNAFVNFQYPNDLGPGVYDIHSPRVPSVQEMIDLLKSSAQVLPPEHLWVNPDCGLKTRNWEEVRPALKNMVTAAEKLRGIKILN